MRTRKAAEKFPLWRHPSGQWCKKHRGRNYYFGTDKDEALKRYAAEWDDVRAGRAPRRRTDGVTVADLANHFLSAKRGRLRTGELSERTWSEYCTTGGGVVETLGT